MFPSKIQTLISYLKERQPGAVAFSGGVDSTLLLYLAREAWSAPPLALTFVSPLLTAKEQDRIQKLADFLDVRPYFVKTKEYLDQDSKKILQHDVIIVNNHDLNRPIPF